MRSLFVLGIIVILFTQSAQSQDTIILKDGKIITGVQVVEVNKRDVQYIRKNIINDETLIIPRNNIGTIKYKNGSIDIFKSSPKDYIDSTKLIWKKQIPKYYNITELTLLNSIGIQHVIGFRSPYVYFGFGAGIYHFKNYSLNLLPLFVDFRVNFTHGKIIPYFLMDFGYSISLKSNYRGGEILDPAIGFKFSISNKRAIDVNFGYRFQDVSKIYKLYENVDKSDPKLSSFRIRLGFSF
jgi:hypothetical protein